MAATTISHAPTDTPVSCGRCGSVFKKTRYLLDHMKRYETKNTMCNPAASDITYDELREGINYKPRSYVKKSKEPRPTIKQMYSDIQEMKTQIIPALDRLLTSHGLKGVDSSVPSNTMPTSTDDDKDGTVDNNSLALLPFFMAQDIVGLAIAKNFTNDDATSKMRVRADGSLDIRHKDDIGSWTNITNEDDINRILNGTLKTSCEQLLAVGADFLVLDEMRRLAGQPMYSPKAALHVLNEAFAELTSSGFEHTSWMKELKNTIFAGIEGDVDEEDEAVMRE